MDEEEFQKAKQTIIEYLIGTLKRKTEEFKAAETDKEKRRIKFLMNHLKEEMVSIRDLKFEDI